jgi:hypothetical protein
VKEAVAPDCSSAVILALELEDVLEPVVLVRLVLAERARCPVVVGVGIAGMKVVVVVVVVVCAGCDVGPPLEMSLPNVCVELLLFVAADESTESGGENGMATHKNAAQLWV